MLFLDRLSNLFSGLGTAKDKTIANIYGLNLITPAELNAMHRSDWMARKIVDIIPDDMTREWREWKADEPVVEQIEEVEKDPLIGLQAKVNQAMQMARLRGGAALYMGVDVGRPEDELVPDRVGKGALKYVHVLSRDEISYTDINRDVTSPYRGEPIAYQVTSDGMSLNIHPSRIIRFIGVPILDRQYSIAECWGDSILQVVYDAVQNAGSSQQHIASMVPEAKTDVIYIPGLSKLLQNEATTKQLTARFTYANQMKSMFNMLLLESSGQPNVEGEKWEQKTINLAQFPELMRQYLQVAAGAADIPLTRFLGDAPSGLGSNGDHSLTNYYDSISARQRNVLSPALKRLDEVLIRSATGSRDPDIWYEWAPLYTQTEKERAEVFKIYADGARQLVGAASGQEIIPREAVSDALINRLVEDGNLPGLEQAIEEYGKLSEQEPSEEEKAAALAVQQASNPVQQNNGQPTADASPRTLYVCRKVLNGDEIVRWAKAQGFTSTLPASDMHVTIAYSRTPVDWMKVDEDWNTSDKGDLTVAPGGPRVMERFGEATVLCFQSWRLQYRHNAIKDAGATWDYPEYQPHISVAYDGAPADLSKVEPYQGEIHLGPELFAEIKDDWQSNISEE